MGRVQGVVATKLIVQEEGHEKMTCKPDMMADGDCWIAVLTPRVCKIFIFFVDDSWNSICQGLGFDP
jgi:hypothetical protein